mgnify:CR=1 FL=1
MARIRMTMMRYAPAGYGGTRRSPEDVKREGWQEHGLLAVSADDPRLSWPERELVAQLGRKLYGPRSSDGGRPHG